MRYSAMEALIAALEAYRKEHDRLANEVFVGFGICGCPLCVHAIVALAKAREA